MIYELDFYEIKISHAVCNRLRQFYRATGQLEKYISTFKPEKSLVMVANNAVLSDLETIAEKHNYKYRVKTV